MESNLTEISKQENLQILPTINKPIVSTIINDYEIIDENKLDTVGKMETKVEYVTPYLIDPTKLPPIKKIFNFNKDPNDKVEFITPIGKLYKEEKVRYWHVIKEYVDDSISKIEQRRSDVFDYLNNIKYPEQRSVEWFENRTQKITASDGACVIGDNKYEPQWKFLHKKVYNLPFIGNFNCHHGKKYENIVTMKYEKDKEVVVKEFGMVSHPVHNFLGASPDGIVSKYKSDGKSLTSLVGRMLEIKCPITRKIETIGDIKGTICPIYYWIQVQLQLECCDLDECDFLQCKILEYKSEDDFLCDTDVENLNMSKTSHFEKGTVLQLIPETIINKYNNSTDKEKQEMTYEHAKYIYPDTLNMTPHDCTRWIKKQKNKISELYPGYVFDKALFWRIDMLHCATIYRDKEWFDQNIRTYDEIWSLVKKLRENKDKYEYILQYLEKKIEQYNLIPWQNKKEKEKLDIMILNEIRRI